MTGKEIVNRWLRTVRMAEPNPLLHTGELADAIDTAIAQARADLASMTTERDALMDEKWSLARLVDQRNHEQQSLRADLAECERRMNELYNVNEVPSVRGREG